MILKDKLPAKYHCLTPFREFFQTGVPILMYHKVGRRPLRARLKGLYVSPSRFVRQMEELHAAGFATGALGEVAAGTAAPGRTVVLTFDDGFRNVLENTLPVLAAHGFQATQFLVADFLGKNNEWDLRNGETPEPLMDAAQVREWLAAGHQIGSHSRRHPCLIRLSVRDAREEIAGSKKKLEDLFGVSIAHFCYPYGDWNERVRDVVLEAGYQTASTTRFGINTPATPPLALHRIFVRHPTRSLKALRARLFSKG